MESTAAVSKSLVVEFEEIKIVDVPRILLRLEMLQRWCLIGLTEGLRVATLLGKRAGRI